MDIIAAITDNRLHPERIGAIAFIFIIIFCEICPSNVRPPVIDRSDCAAVCSVFVGKYAIAACYIFPPAALLSGIDSISGINSISCLQ